MVEQWPFKPLVQGSSPCTLTLCLNGLVQGPPEGARTVGPLRAHFPFKWSCSKNGSGSPGRGRGQSSPCTLTFHLSDLVQKTGSGSPGRGRGQSSPCTLTYYLNRPGSVSRCKFGSSLIFIRNIPNKLLEELSFYATNLASPFASSPAKGGTRKVIA